MSAQTTSAQTLRFLSSQKPPHTQKSSAAFPPLPTSRTEAKAETKAQAHHVDRYRLRRRLDLLLEHRENRVRFLLRDLLLLLPLPSHHKVSLPPLPLPLGERRVPALVERSLRPLFLESEVVVLGEPYVTAEREGSEVVLDPVAVGGEELRADADGELLDCYVLEAGGREVT